MLKRVMEYKKTDTLAPKKQEVPKQKPEKNSDGILLGREMKTVIMRTSRNSLPQCLSDSVTHVFIVLHLKGNETKQGG